MATNPASPEVSGPRKCKLSTKATTNGDPQVVQKKQKSGKLVEKSVTTGPCTFQFYSFLLELVVYLNTLTDIVNTNAHQSDAIQRPHILCSALLFSVIMPVIAVIFGGL